MNGDAEKCDAYDKIDSASNNLNLVFILIHIKLRFVERNLRILHEISIKLRHCDMNPES